MSTPGTTLPVVINHHSHAPAGQSEDSRSIVRLAADGDTLVVDTYGIEHPDPARAVAELLALAAATIDPEAAKDMLGLEISVTNHTTELVLQAGPATRS